MRNETKIFSLQVGSSRSWPKCVLIGFFLAFGSDEKGAKERDENSEERKGSVKKCPLGFFLPCVLWN